MRIQEISLINFRAFKEFKLKLDPQLTVLIGRNGAGKSTVLEGLAVALGAWLSGFSAIAEDQPIPRTAARLTSARASSDIPAEEASYPVVVAAEGEVLSTPVAWSRELRSVDGRTTTAGSSRLRQLAAQAEESLSSAPQTLLPVLAYYGTGRLWLHKREKSATKGKLKSRLEGYRASLEAASDHKGFEAWMAWRENDRLQRLARADEEGRPLTEVSSPELEAVSAAACGCLEGAKRIYYSANHRELRVEFEQGASIPFEALSDGQRNLIAVAADIAWRALQLNPHLGARAPSQAPGVVLIDEVDLHLHPAWQWRVLDDLRRTFPKIQFVVTTHSPQVMSSAPGASVCLIGPDHRVHRVREMAGKDVNTILEDIFGVTARPQAIRDKLDKLARLIEDGEVASARALLDELSRALGEEDTEVVSARWEISLAEVGDAAD
ncbi:AAA family ATPase [Chondromyces apiculatus]|uniref:AAA+ ATPase domain-containing protein n=1 Tax=Chondromyces apiculatus DSM 436 TaxID=1192034 RepID=A0A017T895_9BACT|nr:AAA family ATPase [Chondromyces apiculatus]EYF05187.1 Hypothetical protein CAP_3552 [Chondromyces apiculatus DSM 436]